MLCDSGVEPVAAMFIPVNPNRRGPSAGPGRFGRSPTLLDSFHTSLLSLMETMKTLVFSKQNVFFRYRMFT